MDIKQWLIEYHEHKASFPGNAAEYYGGESQREAARQAWIEVYEIFEQEKQALDPALLEAAEKELFG